MCVGDVGVLVAISMISSSVVAMLSMTCRGARACSGHPARLDDQLSPVIRRCVSPTCNLISQPTLGTWCLGCGSTTQPLQ